MSTSRKFGGSKFTTARQRRKDVIAFYANLRKTPGMAGVVATGIWQTLVKIHKDSTLNGPQKEHEFRKILRTASAAPVGSVGPG